MQNQKKTTLYSYNTKEEIKAFRDFTASFTSIKKGWLMTFLIRFIITDSEFKQRFAEYLKGL